MKPSDLDAVYTQLANAVHDAGDRSEVFLAMLSLKFAASVSTVECISIMDEVKTAFGSAERGPFSLELRQE